MLLLLFGNAGSAITPTNPDPDNFVFMRYRGKRHFVMARNKRAAITYRDKRITVAR